MECSLCLKELCGEDPIGALSCGHCLHNDCYIDLEVWRLEQVPHINLRCPLCRADITDYTSLYLDFPVRANEATPDLLDSNQQNSTDNPLTKKNGEISSAVIAPGNEHVHLCVEDAGTHYLNGTYRRAYEGTEIFYYRLGSLSNVESVEIRQQENEDDETCWYIMADYEGWPDNVRQYVAPVSDSSQFIPPSTGWSYVGTPDSVSVAQPPTIHHVID